MATISRLLVLSSACLPKISKKKDLVTVASSVWRKSTSSISSSISSSSDAFSLWRRDETSEKNIARYGSMNPINVIASRSFSVVSHGNDKQEISSTTGTATNTTSQAFNFNGNTDNSSTSTTTPTKNLRERAVDRARSGARRGSAMAKKGAKTTYQTLKQYGPVFIGTYASLYLVTLASIYTGVDSGMIDPVTLFSYISNIATGTASAGGHDVAVAQDMAESKSTADIVISYLDHYALTRPVVPFLEKNPHFANVGVAWVATKFTEPIRIVVSMAIVPKLADYLGYVPHDTAETVTVMDDEKTDNDHSEELTTTTATTVEEKQQPKKD